MVFVLTQNAFRYSVNTYPICDYPVWFSCWHKMLSGIVWTPIRYVTIRYGFRTGAKAMRHSANRAQTHCFSAVLVDVVVAKLSIKVDWELWKRAIVRKTIVLYNYNGNFVRNQLSQAGIGDSSLVFPSVCSSGGMFYWTEAWLSALWTCWPAFILAQTSRSVAKLIQIPCFLSCFYELHVIA